MSSGLWGSQQQKHKWFVLKKLENTVTNKYVLLFIASVNKNRNEIACVNISIIDITWKAIHRYKMHS